MESRRSGALRGGERRWLRRLAFLIGGLLGLSVVGALATLMFGHISGEEFCPETFSRRSFAYFEIPLVGIQVSPISRKNTTSSLEAHLASKKYVPIVAQSDPSWHLVRSMRSGIVTVQGDAAILCLYLDAQGSQGPYWLAWTDQHPELAKSLWPLVAQTARQELYLFLPDLFESAGHATDSRMLERELRAALARNYARLAEVQQELGRHETALELWDQALVYAPANADFRTRRSGSLAALGRTESVAEDASKASAISGDTK